MNTFDAVCRMFVEYFDIDPSRIDADTEVTKLGLDSLALMEFVFRVEDEFKVQLPNFSAADRRVPLTLGAIAAELDALVSAQHPASSERLARE